MNDTKNQKLRGWELALLMALCVTLCTGMWAESRRQELAGGLVRLHVIANSDSAGDQAEKLQMRDRVLAILSPALKDCKSQEEAVDIIENHRPQLEALGDISIQLGREFYPRRDYSTFSLPAGQYVSLRVVMGQGQGKNWWCVVFPPLCTEVLADGSADAFLPLSDSQTALITQENEMYELKFRIVDWWGALTASLK